MKRLVAYLAASTFFALTLGWAALSFGEPRSTLENEDDKRAEFMRQKLEYSKNVLEGLSTDRLALVARSANDLKLLSAAALWDVPRIPKLEYSEYTADFQRIADELAREANAGNLDGATLSYVQLTMNCVNCHKYVRTVDR